MVGFFKKAFLFLLPLLLLGVCYIVTDPFQNIQDHKVYLFNYMMLSRGNVSTKVYLKNKDKYKYDSFLFGSSRSTAHTSGEWAKYLSKDNVPFSFGAWNESIEAMYKRIRLIDSLKSPIRNAFILIDVDRAFVKPDNGDARGLSDHYLISGISRYDYYMADFYYYLKNPRLVLTSIDYSLFHTQRKYMTAFFHMEKGDLDPINNDWDPKSESKILKDSISYYKLAEDKFYKRPDKQVFAAPQISKKKEEYLKMIAFIFKKHQTRYKIVIAPLYDQVKLNSKDLLILNRVFGKQNVYDYSGINSITNNRFNYGNDVIHYRKKVGNLIFKQVYQ